MRGTGTRTGNLPNRTATQTSKYIHKLRKDEKEDNTMTLTMILDMSKSSSMDDCMSARYNISARLWQACQRLNWFRWAPLTLALPHKLSIIGFMFPQRFSKIFRNNLRY